MIKVYQKTNSKVNYSEGDLKISVRVAWHSEEAAEQSSALGSSICGANFGIE